jgi:peptidyl-prolyl cis-trans isomerase C
MQMHLFAALCAVAAVGVVGCSADTAKPEAKAPVAAPVVAPVEKPAKPALPAAKVVAPTTVVAVVAGVEIRQSEVNARLDRVLAMGGGQIPPERIAEFRAQFGRRVLEELVMQTLLLKTAEQAKIEVTTNDIAQALTKLPLPPGQTLDSALAAQGMSRAAFEKEMREGLKIQKLIEQQIGVTPVVTEQQIKEFYESNKDKMSEPETVTARHLLVKLPEGADAKAKTAAKEKAEGLRKQLVAGADFAKLVKENSDDPGSKDKGGEYTFPRGQMVPAFETAAFSQPLKEIGPLVETPFGFHIIQTLAKNPGKTAALAEVQNDIRKYLENQAKGAAVKKYIDGLRAKADIKYPAQT